MENDIISLFLNRKRQNISRYTEILSKYMLKRNIQLNKIINKIIEVYINSFYLRKNQDYSLLRQYFEMKNEKESLMKDVLTSSLLFYQNSGLEKQIEADINTIMVLSNLLYLAISLDNSVNELYNHDMDIEQRLRNYLKQFESKLKISDNVELLFNDLINQIKKDINAEKKFWKNLQTKCFTLIFSKSLRIENYFLAEYKYDLKMLKRYDEDEVMKVSLTHGINDSMLSIYLEMLSVFILKNLLHKNHHDYFFINIYSDYFTKNKNILNIERIFNNVNVRDQLVFCFEYNDIRHNMSVAKALHSKNFHMAVTDIDAEMKLSGDSFDLFDFVFISMATFSQTMEYHDIWNVKKINFVIDNSAFVKISEQSILKENRWSNE